MIKNVDESEHTSVGIWPKFTNKVCRHVCLTKEIWLVLYFKPELTEGFTKPKLALGPVSNESERTSVGTWPKLLTSCEPTKLDLGYESIVRLTRGNKFQKSVR
jgi:hypothetical protein